MEKGQSYIASTSLTQELFSVILIAHEHEPTSVSKRSMLNMLARKRILRNNAHFTRHKTPQLDHTLTRKAGASLSDVLPTPSWPQLPEPHTTISPSSALARSRGVTLYSTRRNGSTYLSVLQQCYRTHAATSRARSSAVPPPRTPSRDSSRTGAARYQHTRAQRPPSLTCESRSPWPSWPWLFRPQEYTEPLSGA